MEVKPKNGLVYNSTMKGHEEFVTQMAWAPDDELLAAGGKDKTVHIWRLGEERPFRALKKHDACVSCVAWSPDGRLLASGSNDLSIIIWDVERGESVRRLQLKELDERAKAIKCVAWSPDGNRLFSGGEDGRLRCWRADDGRQLGMQFTDQWWVLCIAWSPENDRFATGGGDGSICLWQTSDAMQALARFGGNNIQRPGQHIDGLAWSPDASRLASASGDKTVRIWDMTREIPSEVTSLEGHTQQVRSVSFSADGSLLVSKADDNSVRFWRTDKWEELHAARIHEANGDRLWIPSVAFHPKRPILATFGQVNNDAVNIWDINLAALLATAAGAVHHTTASAVHHTTGKIVLVGDHSVGKSALGYRMIHGKFKEQASTHGQQFWVFPALGKRRADGTDCEAILWDFAGQPDYRLVHALFVDNADLALVLFDASDLRDPLHGVGFWLKQLQTGQSRCPIILVAAQTDRGSCTLTPDELNAYCQRHGIKGPIATSAKMGKGISELVEQMKPLISWEDKSATVTTTTFKRIKDYVLGLKEAEAEAEADGQTIQTIVTPGGLRGRLEATDADWRFTDDEMLTAVGHLENYGYVKRLRTSNGEQRVLLQPERLNNLASSFVLEARRNPKGLGALEEKRLLAGDYSFPELTNLHEGERDVLLDSATLLFLEHHVCFRETDPLRTEPYLVFPELLNLKKPPDQEQATEDGVAYTVSGPTENVFASLVVLLGYTHTFTRTNQWQNNARYEVGDGLVCGFRQEGERDGELDFVLCFGPKVGPPVRTLFQGLFESFLARRNLTVMRYEPVVCSNGHLLDRSVVRQRMKEGKTFAFCNECGLQLALPKMAEPIQLKRPDGAKVDLLRHTADQRARFEQAVFRVKAYVTAQKIKPPKCFLSYAWGVPEHERWVEKQLATDLQKAGIEVVLDKWENSRIGSSILHFVERIEECGHVIVVGTPLYRQKAKNVASAKGSVVAAEWDLAGIRMLATDAQKQTVLPVLLAGEDSESFPPLLRGRVYGDFRDEGAYFTVAFDLILVLYRIPYQDQAVSDLRESLHGPEIR